MLWSFPSVAVLWDLATATPYLFAFSIPLFIFFNYPLALRRVLAALSTAFLHSFKAPSTVHHWPDLSTTSALSMAAFIMLEWAMMAWTAACWATMACWVMQAVWLRTSSKDSSLICSYFSCARQAASSSGCSITEAEDASSEVIGLGFPSPISGWSIFIDCSAWTAGAGTNSASPAIVKARGSLFCFGSGEAGCGDSFSLPVVHTHNIFNKPGRRLLWQWNIIRWGNKNISEFTWVRCVFLYTVLEMGIPFGQVSATNISRNKQKTSSYNFARRQPRTDWNRVSTA